MLTLFVEANGVRQRFAFSGDLIAIGRNDDNDLRIGSRFVSQHHCRLERMAKGWKIVDLRSQNGTRVNGAEVTQKILKTGDRIEVGHVPIWFGEAPDEVTENLDADLDEATPVPPGEVVVSARNDGGPRGALRERLEDLLREFRKAFGDERGLAEVEAAVESASRRLFPRPAFAASTRAAKLVEVSRALNSELDLRRCLALIMDAVIEVTEAERGFLILVESGDRTKVKVARNFDQESVTRADEKFSHSIVDEVRRTGKLIVSSSAEKDRRFSAFESVSLLKLRSVLGVPLKLRDETVGVLYLDHRFKQGAFETSDLDLIQSFCDQAAIAIENARLYQSNRAAEEELKQKAREVEELNAMLSEKLASGEVVLEKPRSRAVDRSAFSYDYGFIIGDSPKMIEIYQLLERVIPSDVPVLISGESGTGKELIAKAIHVNGPRKDRPFVKENCAAIPETLLESELFGYRKGAFTGADRDKAGLFQEAHGGTLFLDEIGEMSLEMQKKLLRAIQEGEIRPVGARENVKVDVRLVTATNRNLREAVAEGAFREDLFYRINVVGIEMPSLRERLEDIEPLARHFLADYARRHGGEPRAIDESALRQLLHYHWPGNVRELENEIQRACAIGGQVITRSDFSREVVGAELGADPTGAEPSWKDIVKMTAHQKEREIILRALEENDWKKAGAARALGISRPTLDGKIKAFGLAAYIRRGKAGR